MSNEVESRDAEREELAGVIKCDTMSVWYSCRCCHDIEAQTISTPV